MIRPDWHEYFLDIAVAVGKRASCPRRQVGCVLVNKRHRVLATGYNGPASGLPNCIDTPCAGASYASGKGLDKCQALHSETNAIAYCNDIYDISVCYVTTFPCIHCTKMLLGTSCELIVAGSEYSTMEESARLWSASGRKFLVAMDEVVTQNDKTTQQAFQKQRIPLVEDNEWWERNSKI